MSTSPSNRSEASALPSAAWSVRSQAIARTPGGSRPGWRPRFRTVTSWPSRRSARTRCRLMNSVPPTTRTRMRRGAVLRERHGDAGGRARDAVDRADLVRHEPADGVEGRALHHGDEIVRTRDGVEVGEARPLAAQIEELLPDALGL